MDYLPALDTHLDGPARKKAMRAAVAVIEALALAAVELAGLQ